MDGFWCRCHCISPQMWRVFVWVHVIQQLFYNNMQGYGAYRGNTCSVFVGTRDMASCRCWQQEGIPGYVSATMKSALFIRYKAYIHFLKWKSNFCKHMASKFMKFPGWFLQIHLKTWMAVVPHFTPRMYECCYICT